MFTEITQSPSVLFTYTNNTYQYLKRVAREQDLDPFLKLFVKRRDSPCGAWHLGYVDWRRRYFIISVQDLLFAKSGHMFTASEEYLVHPRSAPCPSQQKEKGVEEEVEDGSEEEEEEGKGGAGSEELDTLREEIADFPWGKRGQRVLSFLRAKGFVSTGEIKGIPLVDILRCIVTAEPPPSPTRKPSRQQVRIFKLLKQLKSKGLIIPSSYITNKSLVNLYWSK